MKRQSITNVVRLFTLCLGAAVLSGCGTLVSPAIESNFHSVRVRKIQEPFRRCTLVVDDRWFTDLSEFQRYVSALPPGSVLAWDSGCIRYDVIPLNGPETTTAAFQAFCKERGIDFKYKVSGY